MNSIFKELYIEERTYSLELLKGNFDKIYHYGFWTAKYTEKDKRLTDQLFTKIHDQMNSEMFKKLVCTIYRNKLNLERKCLIQKVNKYLRNGHDPYISRRVLLNIEKDVNELNFEYLLNKFNNFLECIWKNENVSEDDLNYYDKNHIYYSIGELLYEDYKRKIETKFKEPEINYLDEYYLSKNISLKDIDKQYNKYGLYSITSDHIIKVSNIPKVYDKKVNTHILINDISESFLRFIVSLKKEGYIEDLALRPNVSSICDEIKDISIALEEIQFGKIFSFNNLGIPSVSKLYSASNFNDNLWINIDPKNITFEEILHDFMTYDNGVVTQIVHLEYENDSNKQIIKHIDHEFIFYDFDEFNKRLSDASQKGSYKQRYKTFKIDNSKIPFTLNDGTFFLYEVLNEYFTRKDLLREYFNKVLIS